MDDLSKGPILAGAFGRLVAMAAHQPDGGAESAARVSRAAIDRLVRANAIQYNVDPALIESIIANESGFDSQATSIAGARGLMQLMPETAARLGVTDSYDAAQNVRAGTRYFRGLLDRFGSVELAVAAYNAGPDAVRRHGRVPPYEETQQYVRNVLARYHERSQVGNLPTNAGSQPFDSIVP